MDSRRYHRLPPEAKREFAQRCMLLEMEIDLKYEVGNGIGFLTPEARKRQFEQQQAAKESEWRKRLNALGLEIEAKYLGFEDPDGRAKTKERPVTITVAYWSNSTIF